MKLLRETLTRECPICEKEAAIKLPDHPAGLGTCTLCGGRVDLTDEPSDGRREYRACYEGVDA